MKGGGVIVSILRSKQTRLTTMARIDGKLMSRPFIISGKGGVALVVRRGVEDKKLYVQRVISYVSILQKQENINTVIQLIEETLNNECKRQLETVLV